MRDIWQICVRNIWQILQRTDVQVLLVKGLKFCCAAVNQRVWVFTRLQKMHICSRISTQQNIKNNWQRGISRFEYSEYPRKHGKNVTDLIRFCHSHPLNTNSSTCLMIDHALTHILRFLSEWYSFFLIWKWLVLFCGNAFSTQIVYWA